MADTTKDFAAFAKRERGRYEDLLRQFVEIPSVSAQEEYSGDVQRCAEFAAKMIRDFGGEAEIIPTAKHPLVHGYFHSADDAPTVTIYNHLDVQPASMETEPWRTEPFAFTKEGDRYFGRGTTDDKGPALAALFGALAAREAGIPINVRFVWELEEEIGSPSFEAAIREAGDRLKTDSVLVIDTIWISRTKPACPAGLRGLLGFELSLETAAVDHHSGTTGGAARNPLGELMKLVTEMYDASTGKVKIKGFYDDVLPITRKESDEFVRSGFTVKEFKRAHLLKSARTDNDLDAMKKLWAMPTFEVHGVVGGYTGSGIKTVIPPKAAVKLSCRLVPNQTPQRLARLVKAFVREHNPDVKMTIEAQMFPYKAPTEGPHAEAVRTSMKKAFGKEPVFVREGGSIGAVVSMERVFKKPIMFIGLSLPEHGYHAPNENFDWQQASGGIVAIAHYFKALSEL